MSLIFMVPERKFVTIVKNSRCRERISLNSMPSETDLIKTREPPRGISSNFIFPRRGLPSPCTITDRGAIAFKGDEISRTSTISERNSNGFHDSGGDFITFVKCSRCRPWVSSHSMISERSSIKLDGFGEGFRRISKIPERNFITIHDFG